MNLLNLFVATGIITKDKDEHYMNLGFYEILDKLRDQVVWEGREGLTVPVAHFEYGGKFIMAFDIIGHK